MPRFDRQTVAGLDQFDGTQGKGLWQFDDYRKLSRTTLIIVDFCAYVDGSGQNLEVTFWAEPFGNGDPLNRVILGRGSAADNMVNPQTSLNEAKFCGVSLPRDDNGRFWQIRCETAGKDDDGAATIQWYLCPKPETTDGDSP